MPEHEQQPEPEPESPNQPQEGEQIKPYFYRDEKTGQILVRQYITRNGKSYLVPGETREATQEEIAAWKTKEQQLEEEQEFPKAA